MKSSHAPDTYYAPPADGPLHLAKRLSYHLDEARWGLESHDLLVLTLSRQGVDRLLRGHAIAIDAVKRLRSESLILARSGTASPKIEIPIDLAITLHTSENASAAGWCMDECDSWTALPAAFPLELLGLRYRKDPRRSSHRSSIRICAGSRQAIIRVDPGEGAGDLPANYETQELPLAALRHWRKTRKWKGASLTHPDIEYL